MRRSVAVALMLVSVALTAPAEFRLPKRVYRMKDFARAQAEAREKQRPLTFVYTLENTTCGLCAGASLQAMDELGDKTVVVYVDCGREHELLPDAVKTALGTAEAGRYIPKTVIVDSAAQSVIAIVPYARGPEMDKLLKQAKKKLPKPAAARTAAGSSSRPPSNPFLRIPPDETRPEREWRPRAGGPLTASLVQEVDACVILKRENGNKVRIAKADLGKDDQEYIQELKMELAGKNREETATAGQAAAAPEKEP